MPAIHGAAHELGALENIMGIAKLDGADIIKTAHLLCAEFNPDSANVVLQLLSCAGPDNGQGPTRLLQEPAQGDLRWGRIHFLRHLQHFGNDR